MWTVWKGRQLINGLLWCSVNLYLCIISKILVLSVAGSCLLIGIEWFYSVCLNPLGLCVLLVPQNPTTQLMPAHQGRWATALTSLTAHSVSSAQLDTPVSEVPFIFFTIMFSDGIRKYCLFHCITRNELIFFCLINKNEQCISLPICHLNIYNCKMICNNISQKTLSDCQSTVFGQTYNGIWPCQDCPSLFSVKFSQLDANISFILSQELEVSRDHRSPVLPGIIVPLELCSPHSTSVP